MEGVVHSINTFRNVRARLLRAEHGTWHAGWVLHLAHGEARLRLQYFTTLQPGERVVCECYGDGTKVRFAGRMCNQLGQIVHLALEGAMVYEPNLETVRLQVENVYGMLRDGSRQAEFTVLDISPASLGGLSNLAFSPAATLEMTLQTPNGGYAATVGVANCRLDDQESGQYRVGLHILDAPRLEAAMWQRFLRERAAA